MIKILYGENTIGSFLHYMLTKPVFSSCAGWFCNTSVSRLLIKPFIKTYHIDMQEAAEPVETYRTFNDFFIRKLKKNARPVDAREDTIVSPADGTITILNNIESSTCFPVKQSIFNLELFLQDASLAQQYYGGTLILIRLAPWDYHRFHFPCSGIIDAPYVIPGKYESVHPLVYHCGIQPLTENIRHRYMVHTEYFDDVLIMSVGALFVGGIKETYTPGHAYIKGGEIGYFCFGGSTIVLLFKPDQIDIDAPLTNKTTIEQEASIKMGQIIAYKKRSLSL